MIILEKEQLNIIKNILKKHVPHAKIRVFGSRVNGPVKLHSDLDLAIEEEQELTFLTLAKIEQDFEDSDLPFRVDIMDWNSIPLEIKEIIELKYEILV